MIQHGSSRLGCVVPIRSFWWFSEPPLGGFLGVFSGPFSLGFREGCMCEPFVVLFHLIHLPNPWVKGLDFGVLSALGLEEFLAGFHQSRWGVPTIPNVLHKSVERFGRSKFGFRGVDPRVLFIPSCLGYTGLTSAPNRSCDAPGF
jgi:hypothetical protein